MLLSWASLSVCYAIDRSADLSPTPLTAPTGTPPNLQCAARRSKPPAKVEDEFELTDGRGRPGRTAPAQGRLSENESKPQQRRTPNFDSLSIPITVSLSPCGSLPGASSAIRRTRAPDCGAQPTNPQPAPLRHRRPPAFREGVQKGAMIANDFIIKKDFRIYTMIILRQDKRLRDHAPTRRIRWSLLGCKRRAVGMGRDGWVGDVVSGVTRGRG